MSDPTTNNIILNPPHKDDTLDSRMWNAAFYNGKKFFFNKFTKESYEALPPELFGKKYSDKEISEAKNSMRVREKGKKVSGTMHSHFAVCPTTKEDNEVIIEEPNLHEPPPPVVPVAEKVVNAVEDYFKPNSLNKPELIQKCKEFGIEYKRSDGKKDLNKQDIVANVVLFFKEKHKEQGNSFLNQFYLCLVYCII